MIKKIGYEIKSRRRELIKTFKECTSRIDIYFFSSSIFSPNQASNNVWSLFFSDCFKKFCKNNLSFSNNSEVKIRIPLKSFDRFGCDMHSSQYSCNLW